MDEIVAKPIAMDKQMKSLFLLFFWAGGVVRRGVCRRLTVLDREMLIEIVQIPENFVPLAFVNLCN